MSTPHELRTDDVGLEKAEKAGDGVVYPVSPVDDDDEPEIDEKALLRKIDIQLIPWLSFLYLLSFLDRTSIGNATLYHLKPDREQLVLVN